MAYGLGGKKLGSMLLGTCLPSLRDNASKIRVPYFYLDERLLKHFRKNLILFAHDPDKICKTGDIVLIEELPNRLSTSITHKVLEVVYPCGDITDPVTGKKIIHKLYRDEIEFKSKLFGSVPEAFNYDEALPRGWQEGKKDFSHRETYVKYHEFEEGDENKNQPFAKLY